MGYAECLVEIKMTDISPNVTGAAKPYLSIHVCSVHVDLTSMQMYYFADRQYCFFENTMR